MHISREILPGWAPSLLVLPDPKMATTNLKYLVWKTQGQLLWGAMRKELQWQGQVTPCPVPCLGKGPGSGCQQRSSADSQASDGLSGLFSKNNSLKKYQKWPCPRIICKISPVPCIFNEIKVFLRVEMSGFGPDKQVTESECWVSWMQTGIKLGKKCRSHLSDFNSGEINSNVDVRKKYFSRHGLI